MNNKKLSAGNDPPDMDTYAHMLYLSDFLRDPVIRSVIRVLELPQGSRGLDAGCGIGSHTLLLAEAVGPDGHVTGLDVSSEFLARAGKTAEKSGLSKRVSFRKGDVNRLPFDENIFDWGWSVDCVAYPASGSLSQMKELARVVKLGGTVTILGWSSQQLLPGYPFLEARLNAPCSVMPSFLKASRPESHFLHALSWFKDVGLAEPTAQTFVGEVRSPLNENTRNALVMLFDMFWGGARSEVTPEDWALYQQLCRPESPDFILNLPGYYAFFNYTMFRGTVVK